MQQYAEVHTLKSDVLIVPHHGSKTSSQRDFVNAVSPSISIFTVGYINRFGHPKNDVVDRYSNIESKIFRSDHDGAVLINFTRKEDRAPLIKISPWRATLQRY